MRKAAEKILAIAGRLLAVPDQLIVRVNDMLLNRNACMKAAGGNTGRL
jgi:hypothetical protein